VTSLDLTSESLRNTLSPKSASNAGSRCSMKVKSWLVTLSAEGLSKTTHSVGKLD
jgi:hypothetical protein